MKKCLMIQTKDHKKFFTYEKNLPQLIVFSKVFNAEISTVQIMDDHSILDLEELAPALCTKTTPKNNNYKILEVKIKPERNKSEEIQKYITKNLLNGKIVSLKSLVEKYKLTSAYLCNHFRYSRETLIAQGYNIIKVGGGKYKIEPPV